MNHAISGEILVKEVRFPRSEIFYATLGQMLHGHLSTVKDGFKTWNGFYGTFLARAL